MSHVLLSYARQDAERAGRVAQALENAGLDVWWDRSVPPGKSFDQVIEEALADSHAVVVLWTGSSVDSNWIKAEAAEAFSRKIMVPVLLDDVRPPLAFRRIAAANLTGWDGTAPDPELDSLVGVLSEMAARGPAPPAPLRPQPAPEPAPPPPVTPPPPHEPTAPPRPAKKRSIPVLVWVLLGAAVIFIGGCGMVLLGLFFGAADYYY